MQIWVIKQIVNRWDEAFFSEKQRNLWGAGVLKGRQVVRMYHCETGEAETEWWGRLGGGALWGLKEHEEEWDNTHTQTDHDRPQQTAHS